MRDIPILFSAPMVLGLQREAKEQGTGKSMTRRLAWKTCKYCGGMNVTEAEARRVEDTDDLPDECDRCVDGRIPSPWQNVKVGDRLWVRENLKAMPFVSLFGTKNPKFLEAHYSADEEECLDPKEFNLAWTWKGKSLPSIHMPRAFSRLTLVVTATRAERLQDISEQDCEREGLEWDRKIQRWTCPPPSGLGIFAGKTARECFRHLWSELHGDASWEANPEVVALTFTVHAQNIDSLKEAA